MSSYFLIIDQELLQKNWMLIQLIYNFCNKMYEKHVQIELPIKINPASSPHRVLEEQDLSKTHFKPLLLQEIQRKKALEGQCKIQQVRYLQKNYVKTLIWGFFVTISVFGLLFVKHFKKLRTLLFYNRIQKEQKFKATHIYVSGTDNNQEICFIFQKKIDSKETKFFQFKHLQYQILENGEIPLALSYEKSLDFYISNQFAKSGLTHQEAKLRGQFYGLNEHRVQVPGYFEYLFDCMTGAFFIFQYIVSVIYILEGVAMFGILMIVMSWLTTSVNYILLRRSYNQIKETAEKQFSVRVLRGGEFSVINNTELVPGDIYHPNEQIPCDSFIISGDLFVNEASLTGEDVPISKVKLTEIAKIKEPCHWIYEGGIIETVKQNTLAVAIDTGFRSKRGRTIRKILTKSPKQPQFFNKLIYFLVQVVIVSIIVYFATLKMTLDTDIEKIMVFFKFLDVIACSFPAPFPLYFNAIYSFCLVRLHRDGIIGVQPQKTVQSGRLKTLCFDKTGTLTQNKMKLDKIFHIVDEEQIKCIINQANQFPIISGLFATCHSVEMIGGEAKGDQIDLQMFLHSKSKISANIGFEAIRTICQQHQTFDILRINQYESKFQSMSVLVRCQNKYYIFVKGSPQMIHMYSQLKNHHFDTFIKELSLGGYRSIAFGYRQVKKEDIGGIMKMDRGQFIKDINILGVVSFVNLLKTDACQLIQLLAANEINTKIITGDNIYLGIQTAILTGMVPANAKIAIIQGSKCKSNKVVQVKTLTRNEQGALLESNQQIQHFYYKDQPNLYYAIDNDFIQMNPDFLNHSVKVFARISPQNKALIVRKHKQLYKQQIQSKTFFQRHLGECGLKVGMVGDGANDLIAIKQADVGIGIAGADAVYSASFAIKDLMQIEIIIRQAKNTQRQAIGIVQYFGVVQLLLMLQGIILTKDASSLGSMQYIYSYFVNSILLTLFLGLSRPAEKLTKYFNTVNFMGLQNHLVYWGNMTIFTLGMAASYQYYASTTDFVPNPTPTVTFSNGYNHLTKSSTIIFLSQNIVNIFMSVMLYRGSPWKEPFYKNKAFTILFVVNIVLIIPIFFTTKYLSFLDLQPIGLTEAGVVLVIMMGTVLIGFIYNKIIENALLHEKLYHQEQLSGITKEKLEGINVQKIESGSL